MPRVLPLLLASIVLLGGGPTSLSPGWIRCARAETWEQMRDEFRKAQRSKAWKERRDAFLYLASYDGADAVREILKAISSETNGAVLDQAVQVLALFGSKPARDALFDVATTGRGRVRLLVLLALAERPDQDAGALFVSLLGEKDAAVVAQAARALASARREEAVPALEGLLDHKDWQVRRAVAMTLGAWKEKGALPTLARAFQKAEGRDRRDLIDALEAVTGEHFGNDKAAWHDLAAGVDPSKIAKHPEPVTTAFGIPIYGARVVVVLDDSLRNSDPLPFDRERLTALCSPPDGSPIPWFRMVTIAQFAHGQLKHLLNGLPKGTKLQIVAFNRTVDPLLGGLETLGASARKRASDALDALVPDDGIATYDALMAGLDAAGGNASKAWKSGPDEVLFVTVNMPNAGEIPDADAVAAAISLEARLRMVPIDTVGIHYHPYEMCRTIAEKTGGTYVDLTK